jgi:hypothetical protein
MQDVVGGFDFVCVGLAMVSCAGPWTVGEKEIKE